MSSIRSIPLASAGTSAGSLAHTVLDSRSDCAPSVEGKTDNRNNPIHLNISLAPEILASLKWSPGVFRPELDAPQSDRFVRNRDASLSEQLFDVSKAHAESVVEPDGVADDFRWKSIAVVAWRIGLC